MENIIHTLASFFIHISQEIPIAPSLVFGYPVGGSIGRLPILNGSTWNSINLGVQRIYSISTIIDDTGLIETTDLNEIIFSLSHGKKTLHDIITNENYNSKTIPNIYDYKIDDLTMLEFERFYPHLILMLHKSGLINSLSKNKHFSFVVKNYKQIRDEIITQNEGANVTGLNFFINYIYGKLEEDERNSVRKIAIYIVRCLSELKGFFFSDIDMMLFKNYKELSSNLDYYLNIIKIPYIVTPVDFAIIMNNKKYIIQPKETKVMSKGFKMLNQEQLKMIGIDA